MSLGGCLGGLGGLGDLRGHGLFGSYDGFSLLGGPRSLVSQSLSGLLSGLGCGSALGGLGGFGLGGGPLSSGRGTG